MLASLGTFHQLWVTKEEYEEHGVSIVHQSEWSCQIALSLTDDPLQDASENENMHMLICITNWEIML